MKFQLVERIARLRRGVRLLLAAPGIAMRRTRLELLTAMYYPATCVRWEEVKPGEWECKTVYSTNERMIEAGRLAATTIEHARTFEVLL